jgi:hypothetical protein
VNTADKKLTFAYDCKLKRPGCVIIQAAMGGGSTVDLDRFFEVSSWLLAPTPDMVVIEGTEEQWKQAGEITRREMERLAKEKRDG